MKLDAIRSFLKLVEAGSYAQAAEESYMSPTTLHSHVKAIQTELNTTLVTFDGRRLDLTAAGQQFLLFAARTVNEYDALRDAVSGFARPPKTRLRLIGMHAPSVHLVPAVVSAFTQDRPEVEVTLETASPGDAIAALAARQVDVAFVYASHAAGYEDSLEVVEACRDELSAVIRADLCDGSPLELLERYPVAALPNNTPSRQYFERWARQAEIPVNVPFTYSSADAILAQVLEGDCIGILGAYITDNSPARDLVAHLDLPGFHHERGVVAMHQKGAPDLVKEFVALAARFDPLNRSLEAVATT